MEEEHRARNNCNYKQKAIIGVVRKRRRRMAIGRDEEEKKKEEWRKNKEDGMRR